LVEYAKSLGKPVLEYQAPEAYADACNDFYDMVMESSNSEETNE
jgi:starch synthase